jgi:hypothetical protein
MEVGSQAKFVSHFSPDFFSLTEVSDAYVEWSTSGVDGRN